MFIKYYNHCVCRLCTKHKVEAKLVEMKMLLQVLVHKPKYLTILMFDLNTA